MHALWLYLMSYRIAHAPRLHALCGVIVFALFLVHHAVNYKWYFTLFKGRYNFRRTVLLVSDLLLFVSMITIAVSSVMLSGEVIESTIPMTQFAHTLHTASTAWGFILMAFHLGFHLRSLYKKAERKTKNTIFEYAWYLLCIALFVVGVFAFYKSTLPSAFSHPEFAEVITVEPIIFYLQSIAIILSCSFIVHWLLLIAEKVRDIKNINKFLKARK